MKRKKIFLSIACFALLLFCSFLGAACTGGVSSSSSSILYHDITCVVLGEEYKSERRADGVGIYMLWRPEIENYIFDGWFYDAEFTKEVKEDDVITRDTTVYARMLRQNMFTCISLDNLWLTITEVCLDGKRPWQYAKSKFIDGYELVGVYFDEDCTQPYDGEPANGQDVTLYFKHSIIHYTITYDQPTSNPTTYTIEDEFVLDAPFYGGFEKICNGWATPSGRLVSEIKKGSTGNLTLSTSLVDYHRNDNEFLCGYYPQTIKDDDITVERYKNTKYYIGSDGYYYLSKTSSATASGTFSNGTVIQPKTNYYFKMQPIIWHVYNENEDGTLHLASKYILDGKTLGTVGYDKNTTLRPWLNQTFASLQFTQKQYDCIKETTIETGMAWVKFETTELIHIAPICWGGSFGGLKKTATDYARLSDMLINYASSDNQAYGFWWMMTTDHSGNVHYVTPSGKRDFDEGNTYYNNHHIMGVVPFMHFQPEA